MKYIEVDEELYRFIASKTERIGESASDILRRLLTLPVNTVAPFEPNAIDEPSLDVQHHKGKQADLQQDLQQELQQKLQQELAAKLHQRSVYQPGQIDDEPNEPQVQVHKNSGSVGSPAVEFTPSLDVKTLVNEHLLSQQKGAVGRFMWLLEGLAALVPSHFNKVLQVQGKGRLYFARSKEELLASSASANPKEIGTTGYWVTTNNNTAKKQAILIEVLTKLRCDESLAQDIAERI